MPTDSSERTLKILIPILHFARGGGTRVLTEFADQWIKSGNDVTFLCPDSSDLPYFPTRAKILWVSDNGTVASERSVLAKPSGRYHLLALFRGLQKHAKCYDVILANQSLTAWPVTFARCGSAKKIYYIQAYEPEYYFNMRTFKNYVLGILSALSYHFPLTRVVNSPIYFTYKNLRACEFVPPGLDLSKFHPAESARALEHSKEIYLGCIGRSEVEKGTVYALQAFEELYRRDNRYRMRIAYGNLPKGWSHTHCQTVIPQNDEELGDFYRSLDILIAPGTAQHGAPHYPVLEAFATEIVVITTGYMGATEKTAWLSKNRDFMSIVNNVENAVSNPNLRQDRSRSGLQFVQQYTWQIVAKKMLELMRRP